MAFALTQLTPPAEEPVTLAEFKSHQRLDYDEENNLATAKLLAARVECEAILKRQFVSATYRLQHDSFPATIYLPLPPATSVESVKYIDHNGTFQTLASSEYEVDVDSEPGRIEPAYGTTWPSHRSVMNAIRVEYTAGYGAASAVPQVIKDGILMLAGYWFENRDTDVVPLAVRSILSAAGYGFYTR